MKNEKNYNNPYEIGEALVEIGTAKTKHTFFKMLILAILAGAFIAFAAEGSNAAVHTIESVGLAKALAGALFSAGLMFVMIAGGELFTGNTLILTSVLAKKAKISGMLKNWAVVYIGNFLGSLLIAYLIFISGQFNFSDGLLGAYTIKTAVYKINLSFESAFVMGILCNWLVCIAVWMSLAAKDITGKILGIFFTIWLFITSGFEHSIANMYYIPAGILAKSNPDFVQKAITMGVSEEKIAMLNWDKMLIGNLLPVTLGNIVGGAVFVGVTYWFVYIRKAKQK